jgi:hypothetical protein
VSLMPVTVGPPFMAVAPALTKVTPSPPASDDPMASVRIRLGKIRRKSSLTLGENTAAVDVTAYSDDAS